MFLQLSVNTLFYTLDSLTDTVPAQQVFLQRKCGPSSKHSRIFTVNTITDRQYCVKIIILCCIKSCAILAHVFQNGTRGLHVYLATFVYVIQVFGYCSSLSAEQHRHLCLCEPHRFLLHPHLQPDAAVGLVEDDFTVLSQVRFLFPKPQHRTSTHVPKPFPSPTQVKRTCLDLRSTWVVLGKDLPNTVQTVIRNDFASCVPVLSPLIPNAKNIAFFADYIAENAIFAD